MKKELRNEIKKDIATGASTAVGAAVGVVIGATVTPITAEAQEIYPDQHTLSASEPIPQAQPEPATPMSDPMPQPQQEHSNHTPEPMPQPMPEPANPEPEPEVEIVGYDRITNEDGSQMDVAVLNVNNNEIGVIDLDISGQADLMVCDINQNGVIEEGEIENVQDQGIAMQPLQEGAGFNPQFAQNDLPDYVNNADVDTYMA